MAEPDDEKGLIRESQQGKAGAFEELVRSHQRMIHALTFRMTGSMTDSEDLAQETFLRAYRQLESYRGESKFSSWLYRIGINLCLNWRKRQQREADLLAEWVQRNEPAASAGDDRSGEIQQALMKLHPKQRAAIVLTVYEGLNHAEAATALGCSETTVSWRVFAARAKLKGLLKRAGDR
jgi:RNA polymerase sigma-70 factor (ECF subfamily)